MSEAVEGTLVVLVCLLAMMFFGADLLHLAHMFLSFWGELLLQGT